MLLLLFLHVYKTMIMNTSWGRYFDWGNIYKDNFYSLFWLINCANNSWVYINSISPWEFSKTFDRF